MPDFDSIIVGAGHNGLVCGTYLARAGQRVLVLEASATPGGLAATREFHPGFQASVAHSVNQFAPAIARELRLAQYGYSAPADALSNIGLSTDGNHVHINSAGVQGASDKDRARFPHYLKLLQKCAGALQPSWLKTMPRVGNNTLSELLSFAQVGIKLRLLGKADMREFFRIASLPARDLMDENFDNELLKATLSWDGLVGSTQAPRSPNNTVLTMLYRMIGAHDGAHSIPAGGVAGLIDALAKALQDAGGELRCNAPVAKIQIAGDESGLKATGVVLADGSEITASRVVSATDPKRTFFELVGAENLEIGFTNRINRLRCDGQVAKLHLALSAEPQFTGLDSPNGRMLTAQTMDDIEFAWDDAKYGKLPERPVMEIVIPSLRQPGLAPAGQHVLSAHAMYIPYKLEGGWTDQARQALQQQLIDILCEFAPGLDQLILHAELLTPEDLEQDCHVTGGHWHHTEFAMDQLLMMRPTYEAAQYTTPIPGLYLCGAGCHPGGGVMGGPGHNAAREILK